MVQLLIPIEKSLDNDILFYKGNITNYFKEMKLYESARAAISTFNQLDLSFWLFSLANSNLEAVASSETFNVQSADARPVWTPSILRPNTRDHSSGVSFANLRFDSVVNKHWLFHLFSLSLISLLK